MGRVEAPETHYARNGDLQIAYQVAGEGPLDIVLVPAYLSNIELFWELPSFANLFGQLSSFARLILFDRRGSGMSDGIAGATPLEETMDDVQAVIDAVGSERPVLLSFLEGCGLTRLYAASHPDRVRALVLISPQPRLVAGPGYEWAPSVEERAEFVEAIVDTWGTASPANPLAAVLSGGQERFRGPAARLQRLAMSPAGAAAALATIGETDVRDVLPSVQCPTLVLRVEGDTYLDERHSRYVADHIPNADYVQVPGDGPVWIGAEDVIADEVQHFLTGVRRPVVSDRVLATVLFTDIVASTDRAAELGDAAWRSLLTRHDRLVSEEVDATAAGSSSRSETARSPSSTGRAVRSAAQHRSATGSASSAWRFAPGSTRANASSFRTTTSAASRCTSAPASAVSPDRARCWSAAPSAISSSAPAGRSPTEESTSSRACPADGGSTRSPTGHGPSLAGRRPVRGLPNAPRYLCDAPPPPGRDRRSRPRSLGGRSAFGAFPR